jgi:hypothetical protein
LQQLWERKRRGGEERGGGGGGRVVRRDQRRDGEDRRDVQIQIQIQHSTYTYTVHTLRTNTLTTALDTNLTIKIVEREAAESPIQSLFTHSIPRKYLINDTYVSAAKEFTS